MNSTRSIVSLVFATATFAPASFAAEDVTIIRDDFGIPHIFAATDAGVCFGMGYAQAEDRLDELLRQYRRATGTMCEAFGKDYFRDDWRQRLWQHAEMAKTKWGEIDPKVRGIIEAYQAGVKQYMKEHPDEVPAWAPEIEPWMCVALARYIIWGWPEGDAGGDMLRGGVQPDPIEYHGSNEWLVGPERTAAGAPIALIDPHLSWYGHFRFYEARLYGGDIQMSGMGILGLPFPTLGHSRFCSVAMTTGGPDAADCYEEELNPDNPRQYMYDGDWREMTVRKEIIRVKDGDAVRDQAVEIEYTHHGPVAAHKNGKAYVLKLPYFDQVRLVEQAYRMVTARNLAEMKAALGLFQLMEQNVMIGTVDGDIFYLRNGRVPVRAKGFDYSRPLAGNTSKTEWLGIHKLDDLVQLENPACGYMQNCNVSPQFLTRDCGLQPAKWSERPYLYNGFASAALGRLNRDNPLHQRAAMCLDLLADAEKLTTEKAIEIAMSPAVFGADAWQDKLRKAWDAADAATKEKLCRDSESPLAPLAGRGAGDGGSAGPETLYKLIMDWNRRCDADSTGAVAYKYWKDQFGDDVKLADKAGFTPPATVTDKQILDALGRAANKLHNEFDRLDVPFGDVYRVGRDGGRGTWPVAGGSIDSIATPRAISFSKNGDTKTFLGRSGQTSTQIVLLTKPPRSWTVLPLGESDRRDSPHYDDQAEKLFSKGKMKPTYFMDRDELMMHAESKTVLKKTE